MARVLGRGLNDSARTAFSRVAKGLAVFGTRNRHDGGICLLRN